MEGEKKPEKLSEALVVAQSQMRHAKMDRVNPHYKNRYATLASVIDACKPALNAAGIAVVQEVESNSDAGTVGVRTVLHFRGEMLECGLLTLKAVQNNPQQIGSALTYARRYALAAAIGIASDEDDDGEAAQGRLVQGGDAPQPRPSSHARTSEVVGAVALAPQAAPRVTETVANPPPPTAAVRPTSPSTPQQAHADAPEGGPSPSTPRFPADSKDKTITKPQAKRLWAIAQGWLDSGDVPKADREDAIKAWLADMCGVEHTADLTWRQYKALGLDDDSGRDDLLRAAAFLGGAPPPASAPPPDDDEPPPHGDDDSPF